jgi:hypothetical protein
MDVGYSHHKVSKKEFSHPRPNFGLLIVKAHILSVKVFERAWNIYQKAPESKKRMVATDQNTIAVSMKWARWRWTYNFS